MNKKKYIEKSSGKRSRWDTYGYNRQRAKYIDPENLPFRESMRYNSRQSCDHHQKFVNWDHMTNYFKANVGKNWNDVYSDMLSKLKEKYKYEYRENTKYSYFLETHVIFIDDLPHRITGRYRYRYFMCIDSVFVDENNIISYYATEDDLKKEYRRRILRKKLLNIMNDEY